MLYLPWRFQKSRVVNCKLRNDNHVLNSIREWVILQNPSVNTSTHWWYKDLPQNIKELFYNTAKDKKIIEMFILLNYVWIFTRTSIKNLIILCTKYIK